MIDGNSAAEIQHGARQDRLARSYEDAYREAMDDVMADDRIFKAEIMEELIEDSHLDVLLQLVICGKEDHLLDYAQRLRSFGMEKIRKYCEQKAGEPEGE